MQNITIDIFNSTQPTILGSLEISDHDDFPLALSMSLANIRDITKRSGISSKTFKVPASKNNNKTLQYLYHIAVSAQTITDGVKAVIKVDNQPLFTGQLKISNLQQTLSPEYYEMEFTGDNLDWTNTLKELKLNELEFSNPHIPARVLTNGSWSNENLPSGNGKVYLTRQTVEASWHGTVDSGWDYVYSLKSYGRWLNAYSHVTIEEMRPDIYFRSILTKAFAAAGYSLSSTFLDSAFFKRLVLPYTGKSFELTADEVALYNRELIYRQGPYQPTVSQSSGGYEKKFVDLSRLLQVTGNSSLMQVYQDTVEIKYTQPPFPLQVKIDCLGFSTNSKGRYNLSFGHDIYASNDGNLDFFIAEYGNGIVDHSTLVSLGSFELTTGRQFVEFSAQDVLLKANTSYVLVAINYTVTILMVYFFPTSGPKSYFKIAKQAAIYEGNQYTLGATLPDIPVLDLLTGLVNMFNLYIQTDTENKVVTIEPRNTFYKPITKAVDWSSKLDISQAIQTTYLDDYNREIQFVFKEDNNDTIVKKLKEANMLAPGSFSYNLPKRYKEGKQQLGNKTFAYTEMRADNYQIPNAQSAATYLPHFWSGDSEPPEPTYSFAPRVLYYAGMITGSWAGKPTRWGWYNDGNLLDTYPVATRNAPGNELAYNTTSGFIAKYYQNDLAQITEGKVVTAHFKLSLADVRQLDLSVPVYISHPQLAGYYWIQTVHDFIPTRSGTTKVELIPIHIPVSIDFAYNQQVQLRQATPGVGLGIGINAATTALGAIAKQPSVVLQNGSHNVASLNGGSIAFGNGTMALGAQQHVLGNYNVASENDIIQIGAGTSNADRYRALTFTQEGNFLVQGGYLYTTDGREIMFASQRNAQGQPRRYDKLHLSGDK